MDGFGIVRKVDELGRVVIPKEMRKSLNIENGDEVEILLQGDFVAVKKFEPFCVFCASKEDLGRFEGKYVCKKCRANLSSF
jgi:transcriptional pleiotropic regulator of transition state genes